MKITIVCIGKTNDAWLKEGMSVYLKRLKHYLPVYWVEIDALKKTAKLNQQEIKKREAALLLKYVEAGDRLFLLDEKGKEYPSIGFSKFLDKQITSFNSNFVFAIGGAFGFSEEVYARANGKISLSQMTFSHQMVRLFVLEQLYRAMTILRGEPYHHS